MSLFATQLFARASALTLFAQGGGRGPGGGAGLFSYSTLWLVVLFGALIVALAFFAIFARYFRLWIQSVTTGAGIGILDLLRMTFRKVNPTVITRSKIMAVQAGIYDNEGLTTKGLEAHYLAGGNVPLVIRSMIAARKAKILDLNFKKATAIDLAGRNILEAVQTSVYPRVIDCPPKNSKRPTLDAVAKNGIQLKVKARVTVRANLDQLIGGATEETIVARVGEGIVSAIGSAETHKVVLENPDRISKAVLARKLDSQTAFEIVSIDIADIDVGDNIGARLQADQAEADTRVARAQAEGRRAMAVSQEQENIAMIEENRAKLVEAEASVPIAMAEAFRTGKLGILDYYKLQNVQADTNMRGAIAISSTPGRK
ncbi:MAG TPA: flotillin-like protein FloA [Pirellulales bacterium]